jgi:hypothetical protein
MYGTFQTPIANSRRFYISQAKLFGSRQYSIESILMSYIEIVVASAADTAHRNKRVTFKSDLQETLHRLDSTPSAVITKDRQPKQRSRKTNDGISNRTRSKAGFIDQNIGTRTRSKAHDVCNENINVNFFLYINFQNQSNTMVVL